MKIYTRTGDDGTTGLFGGARVPKHDLRVSAYGCVDELNAAIGLALTQPCEDDVRALCLRRQEELFTLGALIAAADQTSVARLAPLPEITINDMEHEIDAWETELPALRNFVLPGGCGCGAALHLARTICRRAERDLSALRAQDADNRYNVPVRYLNRLSDWLFVAARVTNKRAGAAETPWIPKKP